MTMPRNWQNYVPNIEKSIIIGIKNTEGWNGKLFSKRTFLYILKNANTIWQLKNYQNQFHKIDIE